MNDVQQGAVIAVMLIVVLAVVGLAGYEVVHDPGSDVTKGLIGAITVAFGSVVAHLFGNIGSAKG